MAAAVAAASAASALALAGTPLFLPAIAAGAVLTGSSLLVLFSRPDEAALFLIAQPAVFLSWSASPLLAAALESLATLAFLASTGFSGREAVSRPQPSSCSCPGASPSSYPVTGTSSSPSSWSSPFRGSRRS